VKLNFVFCQLPSPNLQFHSFLNIFTTVEKSLSIRSGFAGYAHGMWRVNFSFPKLKPHPKCMDDAVPLWKIIWYLFYRSSETRENVNFFSINRRNPFFLLSMASCVAVEFSYFTFILLPTF
jgi:hypothetical protein